MYAHTFISYKYLNMSAMHDIKQVLRSLTPCIYRSVPGKRPPPGKRPCTIFQEATVAPSIQKYGILIPGKHPCRPKLQVMFKCPWALTRDTMVYYSPKKPPSHSNLYSSIQSQIPYYMYYGNFSHGAKVCRLVGYHRIQLRTFNWAG